MAMVDSMAAVPHTSQVLPSSCSLQLCQRPVFASTCTPYGGSRTCNTFNLCHGVVRSATACGRVHDTRAPPRMLTPIYPWLACLLAQVHACLMSLLKGVELKVNDLPAQNPEEEHMPPEESALAMRLRVAPETLELVMTTDALMTQTLGQLLMLLRVFSFS